MRVENSNVCYQFESKALDQLLSNAGVQFEVQNGTVNSTISLNNSGHIPEDLPRVVDLANKFTKDLLDPRKIEFKLHAESGRTMVVVTNPDTGKVLREIPSKEFLDFVAAMNKFAGLLFDHKI